MTYDTQKATLGRIPVTVVEMDLDKCALEYGQSYTNLLTYSEQFDNAAWTKTGGPTITANAVAAPDQALSADEIDDQNTTTPCLVGQTVSVSAGTGYYTASIYLKAGTSPLCTFNCYFSGATEHNVYVDLSAGTISYSGAGAARIDSVVNGWYRVSLALNDATGTLTSILVRLWPTNRDSAANIGSVYAWGAQLVEGSTPGHYVTTTSASASKSCTAALSAGSECYNTRKTCQDTANYTRHFKTYRLIQPRTGLPMSEVMYPCLDDRVTYTPTEIQPKKGLAIRSAVDITVRDFAHHDRGMDPYAANRASSPGGTFFGRLFARNPYYVGRLLRVRQGYITDPWDWNNFRTRLYVIDSVQGPKTDSKGNITWRITGKDILKLGDDRRIQIPAPSDGKLAGSLTAGHTTSFDLDANATLADYPTGGATVAMGKEILSYASRSGVTCSTLVRGLHGTEDIAHNADETVQICRTINANIVDVIHGILTDDVGIDESYIPYDAGLTTPTGTNDEWDDEQDNWLNVTINTIIAKPMGALSVLDALCRENQIDLFWDEEDQEIKLKTNTPPLGNASVTEINETGGIVKGSLKSTDKPDLRVSRAYTYFDKINRADDDKESNFAITNIYIDTDAESADTYDEVRADIIKSLFFTASNSTNVTQMQQRLVGRYGDTPQMLEFELDAKDESLKVGDLADITVRDIVDEDGNPKTVRYQIIYKKETEPGHRYKYRALTFSFSALTRYAFIGPNTLGDYSTESDANKNAHAFVGPNTGLFSDGGTLYVII